jgi:hypothetical protein
VIAAVRRAAVRLEHIAVQHDGVLAERGHVHHGPDTASDQPGDLLGTPTNPALDGLAIRSVFVERGSIA